MKKEQKANNVSLLAVKGQGTGLVFFGPTPDGLEAQLSAEIMQSLRADKDRTSALILVARDDKHMRTLMQAMAFFLPATPVLPFPAWDCLPYDRVSPQKDLIGQRLTTLAQLSRVDFKHLDAQGLVVVTTVNALLQRTVPKAAVLGASFEAAVGESLDQDALIQFLNTNGYFRSATVHEPGEYAIRGGIIDIFPTAQPNPIRIDLFGDEIESIKRFDALSQTSVAKMKRFRLFPISEVPLTQDAIERFRTGYRAAFGTPKPDDVLYESISAGRAFAGMEHWLPLFYEQLDSLTDYMPGATVVMANQVNEARAARAEQVQDFFEARQTLLQTQKAAKKDKSNSVSTGEMAYNPLPIDALYWNDVEFDQLSQDRQIVAMTPFRMPASEALAVVDPKALAQEDFAEERRNPDLNLYDAVRDRIKELQRDGKRVLLSGLSQGTRTRLGTLLKDAGLIIQRDVDDLEAFQALEKKTLGLAVLPMEQGYSTADFSLITEQDILGDRLSRPKAKKRKAENFLSEAASLEQGDLVVHLEHGIGKFMGLMTLDVNQAAHDVLHLQYAGGDKLYLPVENIEILSRYGSDEGHTQLDKLGSASWQARRAATRKKLKIIASELLRVAAARALRKAEIIEPMAGVWDDFCARFPFAETDDQLRAIEETIEDLSAGKPMDRLVCGDVGFGKTEVALRAAFVAAMSGKQVAITVPTTLLSRQHFASFSKRFEGFPIRVAQLSRLVTTKEANLTKKELESGHCDVVIGTHALLSESIKFKDLGLLVIDEEQRFGVKQKERLKKLRETVHVLTLSATPIPRTLQLAMSGVKELSLIATPPVDRLAVRTFVMPWDGMIIREALMREHFRGGQSFVVCPRLRDMTELEDRLKTIAPELKVVQAHGQLAPSDLETVMTDFYDKKYDVLLSTNIVESGLDIPSVNTLIIHRADMFGLSALYQLRGRVGRSKLRGYAYLTLQPGKVLTPTAQRRLEVMSTLDGLGAGFTLASHDMDIRGAGNLIGEEQSGHIKEVGIELYQQMLEEAVRTANAANTEDLELEEKWSPKIEIGMPVLIPDTYVTDLSTRMGLYRRMANFEDQREIEAFAAELIDRFGKLPAEVENLLQVLTIKRFCRLAGIEKIDVGPAGAVVSLRNNSFAQPEKLLAWVKKSNGVVTVRPDQKLFYKRNFGKAEDRAVAVLRLIKNLAKLAVA